MASIRSCGLFSVAAIAVFGCGDAFTSGDDGAGLGGAAQGAAGGGAGSSVGGSAQGGGGSGGCGDTKTDPNNCGVCGHSCIGGDCLDGVCQPFTIDEGYDDLAGVALVGESTIYWTAGNDLWRYTIGGDPEIAYTSSARLKYLTHAGGSLYWTNSADIVAECVTPCTSPTQIANNTGVIEGIAVLGNDVYWTEYVEPGCVVMVDGGSNQQRDVVCDLNRPEEVAVASDGTVFFTEFGGGTVWSRIGDAAPVPLAEGQPGPAGLDIDDTHVYFGTQNDDGKIWRVPRTGAPSPEFVANSDGGNPKGIAVNDAVVVWADSESGRVLAVAK